MIRFLVCALLAFVALGAPASAQFLSPFGGEGRSFRGFGGGDDPSPRRGFRSYDLEDDDDWDERPRRRSDRRSKRSYDEGPELADGGPRPTIEPEAPETVSFPNQYGTGTVVIDTARRKLYYVLSATEAYQYPISVGREGFRWTGTELISHKTPWPDWYPPEEMREREPHLPKKMTGGRRNPLGAFAIYLGQTQYRIHGTNDVKSLGRAASSGCFRMKNAHVLHLASLVEIGAIVEVMTKLPPEQSGAVAESKS